MKRFEFIENAIEESHLDHDLHGRLELFLDGFFRKVLSVQEVDVHVGDTGVELE